MRRTDKGQARARRPISIRPAGEVDPQALLDHVVATWHADSVVAHRERMYPARLHGFVALDRGRIVGHVSYRCTARR